MLRSIALVAFLGGCAPIYSQTPGNGDDVSGTEPTDDPTVLNEIGEVGCYWSGGSCLNVPGRVIGASESDVMVIVGVFLGTDPDDLSNEVNESAAIGWAEETDNPYDIGHATSARVVEGLVFYEFPLDQVKLECNEDLQCGADTLPDGYYRLSVRTAIDPDDFDFDGSRTSGPGLQVAYAEQVTGWGDTDGDVQSPWVWRGIEPKDGRTVSNIVLRLDDGRYEPADDVLPDDLRDL